MFECRPPPPSHTHTHTPDSHSANPYPRQHWLRSFKVGTVCSEGPGTYALRIQFSRGDWGQSSSIARRLHCWSKYFNYISSWTDSFFLWLDLLRLSDVDFFGSHDAENSISSYVLAVNANHCTLKITHRASWTRGHVPCINILHDTASRDGIN